MLKRLTYKHTQSLAHTHLIDPETLTVNIEALLQRSCQLSQFGVNVCVKIVKRETQYKNHGRTSYDPVITGLWIGLCPFAQLISHNMATLCILPQRFKEFSVWPDGVL